MFNYKKFIIYLLVPIIIGLIGNLLGNPNMGFDLINKPSFLPPGFLFPIVWTILYLLMGISSYLVSNNNCSLIIYGIQLLVNMFWTFFFFNLKCYLFSFIWIIILIGLVITMIIKFYKINKTAAYIQIPYLFWLVFAAILNFSIYLLN